MFSRFSRSETASHFAAAVYILSGLRFQDIDRWIVGSDILLRVRLALPGPFPISHVNTLLLGS